MDLRCFHGRLLWLLGLTSTLYCDPENKHVCCNVASFCMNQTKYENNLGTRHMPTFSCYMHAWFWTVLNGAPSYLNLWIGAHALELLFVCTWTWLWTAECSVRCKRLFVQLLDKHCMTYCAVVILSDGVTSNVICRVTLFFHCATSKRACDASIYM